MQTNIENQICVCIQKAKGGFSGSLATGIIAGIIMTVLSLGAIAVSIFDHDISFLIVPTLFLLINLVLIINNYVKFKKAGHSTECSRRYARLSALRSGPMY